MTSETKVPQPPAPFTVTFSPNTPELLRQMGCTLAISTYQAGKVVFLSAKDDEALVQLPRTFERAMGLAVKGEWMAVAAKDEVVVLRNSPELGNTYPKSPNTYDAFYVPRASYYTGMLDIHDMEFGKNNELYAVNTLFSCICKIDAQHSFTPIWKPKFVTNFSPQDSCHLNGMAMWEGQPMYATSFNQGNEAHSWRSEITTGGTIMHVPTGELLATGVTMPHSPRLYQDGLYVLLSATGELAKVEMASGKITPIIGLDGFVRGLARYGDYMFVGLSKLRKNSSVFAHLPISDKAQQAGVAIVHLPTATKVGHIYYRASVDEIYDVQVLPNVVRPGIINNTRGDHKQAISTPSGTFWANPPEEDAQ